MTRKNLLKGSDNENSLAKEIIIAICIFLALYGLVFEFMYQMYGTGSQWVGRFLVIPAFLYFGSLFLGKMISSIQTRSNNRQQLRQDQKILNLIEELATSSDNAVFLTIIYIATQIEDTRNALAWLLKAATLIETKRAKELKTALFELSEGPNIRMELFKMLRAHIRSSSQENWLEALKKEEGAEPYILVRLLSESKSTAAAPILLRTLAFPDPRVRSEAMSGLRGHFSENIVSELLDAIGNETDNKVEDYFRYYFYMNRDALKGSERRLSVFNLTMDRWWDRSHLHEHSKGIIVALLPSLSLEERSKHFRLMLDLLSSTESKSLDHAILEVLESNFTSSPAVWIKRNHLIKIREVFHRNPDRKSAFKSFQQIIAHGVLIGFVQPQNDPI